MRSSSLRAGLLSTLSLLIGVWACGYARADELLRPGSAAPGFVLKSTQKKPLVLRELCAKNVVLVNFFILGSGFCQRQLPELQKVYDKHHGAGLEVICIGVGKTEGEDLFVRFWEANKLTLPVAKNGGGPNDVFRLYHGSAVPVTYLIGKDGKVLAGWAGFPVKGGPVRLEQELARAGFK